MKIRLKTTISGSRDGAAWPARGETVDLPKDEALQMCRSGMAEPVGDDDDRPETATVPDDSDKREALTTESASAVVAGPGPDVEKKPAAKPAARKTAASKPSTAGK